MTLLGSPIRFRAPSALLGVVAAGALAGCGDTAPTAPAATSQGTTSGAASPLARAQAIQDAVRSWAAATSLRDAKAAAEQTRNLITGPHVPGAGDGDRDGDVVPVSVGLLPGSDGSPGLASGLTTGCPARDVLGGSWANPQQRWADVLDRVATWTPASNRFPDLPSHAQRTVGWASLALKATTLTETREYAGHASGHAAIVTAAIKDPRTSPCPGGGTPVAQTPAPDYTKQAAAAVAAVANGAALIDVRRRDEWDAGHARGAQLLTLAQIQAGQLPKLDKDRQIFVYCHTGRRAAIAVDRLRRAGFTNVTNIGGLSDWQHAGGPLAPPT